MPILAAELVRYLPANRPIDDASTAGGALQATARPLDAQFAAAAVVALVSTAAGDTTQTATIVGRDAAGTIQTEGVALNGTTEVLSANTYERIHSVTLDGATAGTVTVMQGSGGTVRHTFAPGELVAAILFQRASSDAAQVVRYEKEFWRNDDDEALDLQSATVELTADPSTNIRIGLAAALDDTATIADRLTAPGGITFVDDNVSQNVPGGTLPNGQAIAVWVELDLPADEPAALTTYETTLAGTTT